MERILLCTFAHRSNLQLVLHYIKQNYDPRKLFVFNDVNNTKRLYITYNTTLYQENIADTILIHRKPETSTLYTINALNKLIQNINNGVLDKSYRIDWNRYRNSIILLEDDDVNITELNLFKIYHN